MITPKLCKVDNCINTQRLRNGRSHGLDCETCSNLKKSYGITTPERDAMIKEQGYVCLICNSPIEFSGMRGNIKHKAVIDHCHVNGNIRGILCGSCNTGLGLFYDSVENLQSAIWYLNGK